MADTRQSRKHRDILWHAQDGKCFYCGIDTVIPKRGGNGRGNKHRIATVEHRHPRSRHTGQRMGLKNKVMTCTRCNNRKGLMLEQVWMLIQHDHDLSHRIGKLTHNLHMLGLTEVRDRCLT